MSKLGRGFGNRVGIASGVVEEWHCRFIDDPEKIRGKIIHVNGHLPLYVAAMLIDHGAHGVLISEGGRNYHPLIILADGRVPAISGVGNLSLAGAFVVVDSIHGDILDRQPAMEPLPPSGDLTAISPSYTKVYVNVGYPTGIKSAAESGADGIGLLRTEFIAVAALSRMLHRQFQSGETVLHALTDTNEADVIYRIAEDAALSGILREQFRLAFHEAIRSFSGKEIIIRTLDIARSANDPLGNRGIRRCIAEGGRTLRLIAEALIEAMNDKDTLGTLFLIDHKA